MIEGDTGAALALRNAVDDAELDLARELSQLTGPLEGLVRQLLVVSERRTGVCLTRKEEAEAW